MEKIKQRIFTNQSLRKLIIPLVIEQGLAMLVGFLDAVMVSSLGEASGSGVSLVDMINNLIFSLFAALATGGAVVASQFLGAKNQDGAQKSAGQLILVSLLISLFVMILSILFNYGIIRLFFGKIDDDVMDACRKYFYVTAISFPFLGVYNAVAALFRAMGNSKVTMLVSLISNVLNFIGNYFLIFVIPLGVVGAASSTVFARFVAMVLALILLTNRKNIISISFRHRFHFDFTMIRKILSIGIPSGIENSLFQLGRVIVVTFVSGYGTTQIAANAVSNTICGMGCIAGQAMGLALVTVIGQCVGAGNEEQVRYYIKKMMVISYLLHGLLNLSLIAFLSLILRLYVGYSQETLSIARELILLHSICGIFLWPLSFVFPNALRAANDVKYTMVVSILSMAIFRITFSFILGSVLHWGVMGIWVAMIIDWVCRCICFFIRYHNGKWKKHAYLV